MKKEKYKGLLQRINTKLGILKCVIYALLLIAQVWYIVLTVLRLQTRSPWVLTITPYVAVAVSLYIYSRQSNSSFRIMWILLISAFPILGVCLYLLAGRQSATKRIGERFNESEEKNLEYLPEDRAALEKFQAENKDHYGQAYYLSHYASKPIKQVLTDITTDICPLYQNL
nr:PLD nuclease N-terminal domain-containing protein [uncultured Butyrivibrio sp.]